MLIKEFIPITSGCLFYLAKPSLSFLIATNYSFLFDFRTFLLWKPKFLARKFDFLSWIFHFLFWKFGFLSWKSHFVYWISNFLSWKSHFVYWISNFLSWKSFFLSWKFNFLTRFFIFCLGILISCSVF